MNCIEHSLQCARPSIIIVTHSCTHSSWWLIKKHHWRVIKTCYCFKFCYLIACWFAIITRQVHFVIKLLHDTKKKKNIASINYGTIAELLINLIQFSSFSFGGFLSYSLFLPSVLCNIFLLPFLSSLSFSFLFLFVRILIITPSANLIGFSRSITCTDFVTN
jgi:nitrate/nitrite transporter NarK